MSELQQTPINSKVGQASRLPSRRSRQPKDFRDYACTLAGKAGRLSYFAGATVGIVLIAAATLAVLFVGCANKSVVTPLPARTGRSAPGSSLPAGIPPGPLADPGEELWVITRSMSDSGLRDRTTPGSGLM